MKAFIVHFSIESEYCCVFCIEGNIRVEKRREEKRRGEVTSLSVLYAGVDNTYHLFLYKSYREQNRFDTSGATSVYVSLFIA